MSRPSAQSRLLIVIPAWNEEEVLGDVLEMVKAEKPSFADILVVSDGSTDATADIARAAGVAVLDLPLNLGVGGAMRAGFQYARRVGYEYACQLDADGQHDPREIETLIETASSEHADVVIGSRFAGKGSYHARGPRKWAMNLFSFILSRVCETRLSDTTSGFKLYGPRALSLFAHNYPAEYLGALALGRARGRRADAPARGRRALPQPDQIGALPGAGDDGPRGLAVASR